MRTIVVSKGRDEVELPAHSSIIVGGEEVPCKADVVWWGDSGLEVKVGSGARRRKEDINFFVLHWTGGEGDAYRVFETLQTGRSVKLGAEFIIDGDGVIFQCCDPLVVDTFDAGRWNPWCAGVEIVNYGFRRSVNDIPKRGKHRRRYPARMRGLKRTYAAFTKAQQKSALALCDAVCLGLDLPHCVPREQDGSHADRTLSRLEIESFRGVLGHYHLSDRKSDPGTSIFRVLEGVGYD